MNSPSYNIVDAATGEPIDKGYMKKNAAEKKARKLQRRKGIAAIVERASEA